MARAGVPMPTPDEAIPVFIFTLPLSTLACKTTHTLARTKPSGIQNLL